MIFALLTVAVASWALLLNYQWQVDVRRLMAIDGGAAFSVASMLPVAAVTAYVGSSPPASCARACGVMSGLSRG